MTLLFSLILSLPQADAQSRKKKRRDVEEEPTVPFKDRLWYGGGFGLGFGANQYQSQFLIGITPMAGYKVTEKFSFGPRLDFQYVHLRADNGFEVAKYNLVNFGAGLFSRYKIFDVLFVHGEYGFLNQEFIYEAESFRDTRQNALLGLGFSQGYPIGTEISILYNFLADDESVDLPFEFRFGFNYKF